LKESIKWGKVKEINPPQPSFKKEGGEINSSLFKGRLGGI
jgi:hypothetical protein